MFIGIQHPGEKGGSPLPPKAATLRRGHPWWRFTRDDGGPIG